MTDAMKEYCEKIAAPEYRDMLINLLDYDGTGLGLPIQDDTEQSMNAGMNEHITKPIDLKRLINTIHSHVKQKKFNLVVDKSI